MDTKSPPPDPSQALNWKVCEVSEWIRSLNPDFHKYTDAFERDSVDGSMLLNDISEEWLVSNVSNSLHRKRIAREITNLTVPTKPAASDNNNALATTATPPPPTAVTATTVLSVPKDHKTGGVSASVDGSGTGKMSVTASDGSRIRADMIGSHRTVAHHHYASAEVKPEPYDFTSIIANKLKDIKLESFGREWLYDRMYEWMKPLAAPSPSQSHAWQPKSLSKILLITGEPVWCRAMWLCDSYLSTEWELV